MASSLTHLALHVRDLEACVDFYRSFCGMRVTHDRPADDAGKRIVWMAEPGREHEFVFVLLPGGPGRNQSDRDFSHLGFALDSREAVDAIAERGRNAGCLVWGRGRSRIPSATTAVSMIRTATSSSSATASRSAPGPRTGEPPCGA